MPVRQKPCDGIFEAFREWKVFGTHVLVSRIVAGEHRVRAFQGRRLDIVATAPDIEYCLTAEIDLDYIDVVKHRYPLMDQRRPELYGDIAKIRSK